MLDSPITTADQLFALDEPGFRHELVRGELLRMSNAGWWHGAVAAAIGEFLRAHARQHKLGMVFAAETGFLLARSPDTVRSPDAAFVRRARVPTAWSRGYFPGAPDLAVEVTSTDDTHDAVREKANSWLAHGAQLVWVIEARTRTASVYRADGTMQALATTDTLLGEHVLPGLAIAIADLFPALD